MNKVEYMKNLYLFNEDQIETVEAAIDLYLDDRFYGGFGFINYGYVDAIFNSESVVHDDFNKSMYSVIENLCDNFNLDKDIFPSFYRFLDEGLPSDDDFYCDPEIDQETVTEDEREQYQDNNKEKLSEILEGLGKELEKLFDTLEEFCLQKKENLNINDYIKHKKKKCISL